MPRCRQAGEALELGLVNRVVDDDRLEAETLALARTVAAKLPDAVAMGKRAFYATLERTVPDAYELASAAMVANAQLPGTRAAMGDFLARPKKPRPAA